MRLLSVQRAKKHCVLITADNGCCAEIDVSVCEEYGLKPQQTLDEKTWDEIKDRSGFVRAKERALWYLDRTDHTERALYEKLMRAGFGEKYCAEVLAWLKEYGMVDDRRYAQNFAERCAEANISKRAAYQKMIQKGVPRDMIREALDGCEADETAQIRAVIEKKYRGKMTTRAETEKVFAALVRKGFSFGAVREVLRNYSEEEFYSEE